MDRRRESQPFVRLVIRGNPIRFARALPPPAGFAFIRSRFSDAGPFDTISIPALERGLGSKIEVLNEYLELHRFPGEHHAQELSASLLNHYAGQDIDAIVPIAFPALEFFLRYLEGAFPKTPVCLWPLRRTELEESACRRTLPVLPT